MKRALSLVLLALAPLSAASAKQHNNRVIITEFARLFYTERDVAGAFDKYVAPDYIQHNPGLADGREAAVAALAPMFADRVKTFTIKRIVVDGNMAVIHVHVRPTPEARGAAVFDMYRLKNGKIVEHWDAIQPIPAESKTRTRCSEIRRPPPPAASASACAARGSPQHRLAG